MAERRILVLGGVGFVGRRLVAHIVENGLAQSVRVVDKQMVAMAFLDTAAQAAFAAPCVQFVQANLSSDGAQPPLRVAWVTPAAGVAKAFATEEGSRPFDIVFNCAAETKFGLEAKVYEKGVKDLSVMCANAAAKAGVGRFVEFSTAQVYQPDSVRE